MRILVIDDKSHNLHSAKRLLVGHDVTLASSYYSAVKILASQQFDVVLTDIMMPACCDGLSDVSQGKWFGRSSYIENREMAPLPGAPEIAYGFVLGLMAAMHGAKYVGFVSVTDHHADPLSWALDQVAVRKPREEGERLLTVDGAKCGFFVASCCPQIEDPEWPCPSFETQDTDAPEEREKAWQKYSDRPKDWLAVLNTLIAE